MYGGMNYLSFWPEFIIDLFGGGSSSSSISSSEIYDYSGVTGLRLRPGLDWGSLVIDLFISFLDVWPSWKMDMLGKGIFGGLKSSRSSEWTDSDYRSHLTQTKEKKKTVTMIGHKVALIMLSKWKTLFLTFIIVEKSCIKSWEKWK